MDQVLKILALLAKYNDIIAAQGPNVALAIEEVKKLLAMLKDLVGSFTMTKKPTPEQIAAVRARSDALDAIIANSP